MISNGDDSPHVSWNTWRNLREYLSGWWLGHPSEKIWKSIGMISNPIYGKIRLMATKPPTRYRFLDNNHYQVQHCLGDVSWPSSDSLASHRCHSPLLPASMETAVPGSKRYPSWKLPGISGGNPNMEKSVLGDSRRRSFPFRHRGIPSHHPF